MVLIAAVEGGGTTFKVAVCREDGSIVLRQEFDSSISPERCITDCCNFLQQFQPIAALGIATFGPVGVQKSIPQSYGRILSSTPKEEWRNIDLLTPLREACGGVQNCTCLVDTDVNAPAYAEYVHYHTTMATTQQQRKNITSCAYITVGTGVGVGLVVNGHPVHGLMHPEGGHIPVHPLEGDTFGGYSWGRRDASHCPFGGINTVEALASSVALTERWRSIQEQSQQLSSKIDRHTLQDVPDDSEIWDHAANALACCCATLFLTLSIERIVLGGGVMRRACLLDMIQERTMTLLNGYLRWDDKNDNIKDKIVLSEHGEDAGLVGAIVLAQRALKETTAGLSDNDTDNCESIAHKQAAFNAGLWHGVIVGVIGTALVVKYGLLGNIFGFGKANRR